MTIEAAAKRRYEAPQLVFEDGLGHRYRLPDAVGGPGVEVLEVRASLSSVPPFEFALRERTARLASFRHASFSRLPVVERVTGVSPGLRIVSETVPGSRLATLLVEAEGRHVTLDISAALCVLRQAVGAVAALHASLRDVAHGALAPERLLVTPRARVVVVDYTLGAAVQQLRYSRRRFWTELQLPLPQVSGAAPFDHRVDVMQLGMVALSLLLGRVPHDPAVFDRLAELVNAACALSPRGGVEPLPAGLRRWLLRALQLDPLCSFPSAIEACGELDTVLGDSDDLASLASLEAFLTRLEGAGACANEGGEAQGDRRPVTGAPVTIESAAAGIDAVTPGCARDGDGVAPAPSFALLETGAADPGVAADETVDAMSPDDAEFVEETPACDDHLSPVTRHSPHLARWGLGVLVAGLVVTALIAGA